MTNPTETVLIQLANENLQYRLRVAELEARVQEIETAQQAEPENSEE